MMKDKDGLDKAVKLTRTQERIKGMKIQLIAFIVMVGLGALVVWIAKL